jgi:catechol 2,3-dioxygenase-like lactoylglutathione lyase family enzyme
MFSHIMIGSNDIARSKKFYDAVFVAMGGQPGTEDARGRLAYAHNGGRFMVSKPIDGKPANAANGGTIGFTMSDPKQAEAWHKAGVANGGTSIEDPPGVRQGAAGHMYLAYLRDPDGSLIYRGSKLRRAALFRAALACDLPASAAAAHQPVSSR